MLLTSVRSLSLSKGFIRVRPGAAAPWAQPAPEPTGLPPVYGINVSLGSCQAVRVIDAALGLEAPRVKALAPGVACCPVRARSSRSCMTHGSGAGVSDSPHSEPFKTTLSVASRLAKLEGLPSPAR